MLKRLSLFLVAFSLHQMLDAQTVSGKSFKVSINPECVGSQDKKALKYLETGRDRKAEKEERMEALRKCLEMAPDCAEAHYIFGLELLRSAISNGTSLTKAESELKECIRLCPEFHFEPYYYLGSIALGRSDYSNAVSYYEKYYALSGASTEELDDQREETIRLDYEFAKFFYDAYRNPVPFEPKKVQGVSTDNDEFLPLIAPDNESMFLTRRYPILTQVRATYGQPSDTKFNERFVESKIENAMFDEGFPLPPPFNQDESFSYGGASITIDNKHLYLTIGRPTPSGYVNFDIYVTDLKLIDGDYQWSELRNLGPNVNGDNSFESQPSISSDGKTLYFCSARADSKGLDIYYTKKSAAGEWGPAVNMGPPINTEGNDKTPFMHSDSRTLYFASDGHLGFGGLDVFLARQNEDGSWSKPVNLGHPINTAADEQGFAVSTDGKRVYYSSKDQKQSQSIDIWNFDLYKEARPDRVVFVKGQLTDEEGKVPANASIELKAMDSKNINKVQVDQDDGRYAAVLAVRDEESVVVNLKADGMAFQSKLIEPITAEEETGTKSRLGDSDGATGQIENLDFTVQEVREGGVYRIHDIYYQTNSAEISEKSKAILDEFAAYLQENPSIRIAIHGHTDDVGKPDVNLTLSTDRAFSVKQYIESKGVSGQRIEYQGFGEGVPYTTNATPEGRAQNRRTEFLILSK